MKSDEVRKKFLEFFEKKEHAVLPSASLVLENDPSVLFTTAGVQPLVPYILQGSHPKGDKLVSIQKCVRTTDIEEIGDKTHATFFEMMGNWSIGDYFKEDAIKWSFEFLTSKEEGLGLDPNRLYVTVFEGDENAPKDEESVAIWSEIFKDLGLDPEKRIFPLSAKSNWWPQPKENDTYSGPCGPSTEMFYDLNPTTGEISSVEEFNKADDEQRVVEIWNDVFMEYEKKDGKVAGKLPKRNVDTGAGFERLLAVLQGKDNIFDTDLFSPIIQRIEKFLTGHGTETMSQEPYITKAKRIIADHIRTSVFLISEGVYPSNKDRGFVLRRLIKNMYEQADVLNIEIKWLLLVSNEVIATYKKAYPELEEKKGDISKVLKEELERNKKLFNFNDEEIEKKFKKVMDKLGKSPLKFKELTNGEPIKPSNPLIRGEEAFLVYSTYGIPKSKIIKFAYKNNYFLRINEFEEEFKKHKELSRTASAGKFKGGLADQSEDTTKLHTAHHLLLAALQKVLGSEVKQKGSNITPERLRIDFSFERKLADEEKQKVEEQVNEWIEAGLEVVHKEMKKEEAERIGAEMEFGAKYPDVVSVYFIQDEEGNVISKEFCGGPHVKNTSEIGKFKIKKEEASSAGVRRIKGILNP